MAEKKNNTLIQYAGMAAQILTGLGLSTWLGLWIDKKRNSPKPLFTWLLPVVLLIGFLVKAIKDTSKK
jgi:hypothetical protein